MADEINESSQDRSSELYQQLVAAMTKQPESFRTLEDTVTASLDSMAELGSKSIPMHDAYGNSLTSIGTDDKVKSFSSYGFDNSTLNWPLWLALYNDSWVFRRAIDKPAQDEINCGFVLSGSEDYSKIYKAYNRYKFDMIQLLQWGALFGGSVAVMMFDGIDDAAMSKPMSRKKIRHRRMRLYVTDRWYGVSESGTETVTNMKDLDFGKPNMYNICFADGHMVQVHHSYVLRYEHRTAPKLIKCGQLQGWGYAEGAHVLNELARDDQLKSSIASLVNKALIEVIKMAGMRGVFMGADKGNEEQLRKRLEMVNWARSYNSLTFLDKDDEYEQRELSNLSGLSNLLETNMWQVAAAMEMQGILFGDLKGGLSQESDAFHRYAVTIENRCNSYYRPVLQKLLIVLCMIYDIKSVPDFEFIPLDAETVNADKVSALSNYANFLAGLNQSGVISKYQSAVALTSYLNGDGIKLDISPEYMNKLLFEEEAEILAAYKAAGKSAPQNILQEQFPQEENPFKGKLSYLSGVDKETTEPVPTATIQQEVQQEQQSGGETNASEEGSGVLAT